jgi:hypothetical protein
MFTKKRNAILGVTIPILANTRSKMSQEAGHPKIYRIVVVDGGWLFQ